MWIVQCYDQEFVTEFLLDCVSLTLTVIYAMVIDDDIKLRALIKIKVYEKYP